MPLGLPSWQFYTHVQRLVPLVGMESGPHSSWHRLIRIIIGTAMLLKASNALSPAELSTAHDRIRHGDFVHFVKAGLDAVALAYQPVPRTPHAGTDRFRRASASCAT